MKFKRRIIMIAVFILVIALFAWSVLSSGSNLGDVFDPATLMIVILIPLAWTYLSGSMKDVLRAMRIMFIKENIYSMSELRRSLNAINALRYYVVLSGLFVTLIGIVMIFSYNKIEPWFLAGISVSLLGILYSLMIVILIAPIHFKIKNYMIDIKELEDEA
jgi:hypothetical protein